MAEQGTRYGKRDVVKVLMSFGLSDSDAQEATNQILDSMYRALTNGRPVIFTNFGTLEVVEQAACKRRNPQTGEPVMMPAGKRVKWTQSPTLQAALNGKVNRKDLRKLPRTKKES